MSADNTPMTADQSVNDPSRRTKSTDILRQSSAAIGVVSAFIGAFIAFRSNHSP
jgi:hypothetical protein